MPSITCGNCKKTHFSVSDVRSCYEGGQMSSYTSVEETPIPTPTPIGWTMADSGIYQEPSSGRIFKVYESVKSGRILCKYLVVDKVRNKGKFVYMGLASRFVQHEWKMTEEDARKFGKVYGICCVCGRTLTDEESVANGIGPICAGKFSL